MTILDSLRALSLYPVNPLTVENIAEECGLDASQEVDAGLRSSGEFKKAQALVYTYLADAPAVSEAGASYSFSNMERAAFRSKAAALLAEIGDEETATGVVCGYIGEDF